MNDFLDSVLYPLQNLYCTEEIWLQVHNKNLKSYVPKASTKPHLIQHFDLNILVSTYISEDTNSSGILEALSENFSFVLDTKVYKSVQIRIHCGYLITYKYPQMGT